MDERDAGFVRASRGEYGERLRREYDRFVEKHPLSAALQAMSKRLAPIVAGDVPVLNTAPGTGEAARNSLHVKAAAAFLRADAVGICDLPAYAVYTHSRWDGEPIELGHKHAIAILVDQGWPASKAGTGHDWIANSMSFLAYATSGFIACGLADYIRRLGYPARAHHAASYQVVVPPILLLAGLGEMCRIGDIVLHPFLGPRFKAAVVTTDMPLAPDKPIDFGLQDFCARCGKCARECPAGAISTGGRIMHNGYERWPLDVRACTAMRVGNAHGSGCGTCIKVCPWNKPWTPFHRLVNWTMRHVPPARGLAVRLDDACGYGRPAPNGKWWLDVEEIDGRLQDRSEGADSGSERP